MTKILAGYQSASPIYMAGIGWKCQHAGCGHDATWRATTRQGRVYAACAGHKEVIRAAAVETETQRRQSTKRRALDETK